MVSVPHVIPQPGDREVDPTFVTETADGLMVEASDIDLRPGEWPDRLILSGTPFVRTFRLPRGEGFEYHAVINKRIKRLVVIND